MYTKEETLERVAYLQTKSPGASKPLYEDLNTALDAYFHRDEEFARQVKYTIHALTYDVELRGYEYTNSEGMPIMSGNYPKGYEDVRVLFDTEGAIDEMMTIQLPPFVAAFLMVAGEAEEGSSTPPPQVMTNEYMVSWTERITAAIDKELEGLKTISAFCDGCGYDVGLAMYFSDYYEAQNPYKSKDYSKNNPDIEGKDKTGIAKKIFVDSGYGWLKDTFEIDMFVPSCVKLMKVG